MERRGTLSCCGKGGSWHGKCGSSGDTNTEHTWHEGVKACENPSQQNARSNGLIYNAVINNCDNETRTAILVTLTSTTFSYASQGAPDASRVRTDLHAVEKEDPGMGIVAEVMMAPRTILGKKGWTFVRV